MIFDILRNMAFLQLLFELDEKAALICRKAGCPFCGGRLDDGSYVRKSRSCLCDDPPEDLLLRFSWCCSVEGCRKRTMPESLRFLGRKVYLGAAIVLSEVFLHGMTDDRVKQLSKILGVDRRTVEDWRRWWLESIRFSSFWKSHRGLFSPDLNEADLPYSIWASFAGRTRKKLLHFLRFLRPLTASGAYIS